MSKAKDTIDTGAVYLVRMARRAEHNGIVLLPGRRIKVSGKVLKELGDAVAEAKPVVGA